MHLGLFWCQLGQNAPESHRILAECRPHPVVAGRRRVALIENEINYLQNRREASRELPPARNLERNMRFRQSSLRANNSLRDGRFAQKISARDLLGGQSPEQA